jgi:hypothetical protein
MHERVSLEHALEGRPTRTEEVLPVHQPAMHLVFDKGHDDACEKTPATELCDEHQNSILDHVGRDVCRATRPRICRKTSLVKCLSAGSRAAIELAHDVRLAEVGGATFKRDVT